MRKVQLLFGIHNHQPVGNFDHIFKKAFSLSYKPFIALLERYPIIKASLHFSGPLLEWMQSEELEFFDKVYELVEKKQVEIMSGGFYEPIFSAIRETDVLGQIKMMNDFIRDHFKTTPRGAWLAERVWDPVLPRLISKSGLSYTLLDSTHFLHTGLSPEQVRGYYVTEREGEPLALFPIDMNLRYSIPFDPPEKTIEYLRYLASDTENIAVTYGDDGEKFGLWPGTYSWVYEKGWLEAFFKELENNRDMIRIPTFSEYLDCNQPEGQIYLPTLSYEEMMQWALPAEAVTRYEDMLQSLENLELKDSCSSFIQGGYWNNFLVKYPESNNMHKKMLLLSQELEKQDAGKAVSDNSRLMDARRELYRGQCNCPYWHGLFGGIYLNYLRHAIYKHLINAEKILDEALHGDSDWNDYKVIDFKKNRSKDILISGKNLNVYFSPADGGGLFEFDFKPCSFNISNIMTRRMEGYHRKLKLKDKPHADTQHPVSIHNISKVKEDGLKDLLVFDWYKRYSFIDHFMDKSTTPGTFSRSRYSETGNFVNTPYELNEIEKNSSPANISFTLRRDGFILQDDQQMPVSIEKSFLVDDAAMKISSSYSVTNKSKRFVDMWFGIEFNFTLLAGSDPLRYYSFPVDKKEKIFMNSEEAFQNISGFEIRNEWDGFALKFAISPEAGVWTFPLETVSQSEDGLERTYQGSSMLIHWKAPLAPGKEHKRSIALTLYKIT